MLEKSDAGTEQIRRTCSIPSREALDLPGMHANTVRRQACSATLHEIQESAAFGANSGPHCLYSTATIRSVINHASSPDSRRSNKVAKSVLSVKRLTLLQSCWPKTFKGALTAALSLRLLRAALLHLQDPTCIELFFLSFECKHQTLLLIALRPHGAFVIHTSTASAPLRPPVFAPRMPAPYGTVRDRRRVFPGPWHHLSNSWHQTHHHILTCAQMPPRRICRRLRPPHRPAGHCSPG